MKQAIRPQDSSKRSGQQAAKGQSERSRLLRDLRQTLDSSRYFEGLNPATAALVFSDVPDWRRGRPLVWVTSTNRSAEEIAANLRFFLPAAQRDAVLLFPSIEADPYGGLSPHPSVAEKRAMALWKLTQGFSGHLITPVASLLARLPDPQHFLDNCIRLQLGATISRDRLIITLRSMGYIRDDPVSEVGSFSFRGGIVDVFSPSRANPVRIDFFGDEIDSLREFDPSTQRSVRMVAEYEVVPMREMTATEKEIRDWNKRAPEYWNQVAFAEQLSEKLQFTDQGEVFNGFEYLFPLIIETNSSAFDYLSKSPTAFVIVEPDELFDEVDQRLRKARERHTQSCEDGFLVLPPEKLFFGKAWLKRRIESTTSYFLTQLATDPGPAESFGFRSQRQYSSRFRDLLADLEKWQQRGYRTLFVLSTEGMAKRLADILGEYDQAVSLCRDGFGEALSHPLSVTTGEISNGFSAPGMKLQVLTQAEVFGKSRLRRGVSAPLHGDVIGRFLPDFRDLQLGDYVVHVDHGIGKFDGLRQIGVGENSPEFVVLRYKDDDKLYVPVDRLDLLQKYSGGGRESPKIDRLGGSSWARTKLRIKQSMRQLAEELLKLYARRQVASGFSFTADDELAREFESAFEYSETRDQRTAIRSTKQDMESNRPMDRLICGDVGYGKTEVAMRAAFKAVNSGRQVAVLAPTTVLAFQHFTTFRERFKGFPVNIGMVSRFLKRDQQKAVLAQTRLGQVDILIGTHRILSKDVAFSALGLVIVDEEQRFGVSQKEKLKSLKAQVDVLTLSATPIPRTLNMSLVGIRDLSIIETPPKDRLAIQTVVVKFSRQIIRSAIDLELKRNGQVFFVHNTVRTIYSIAEMVQATVPEARVAVAHGQMPEQQLEEVMLDFLEYHIDVLVCTTIIENGLDIPRANTIVVNRADRFGLSQLYQLRGRVGRSNRRAYAYLLIPTEETLSTEARKRLAAIREFSDLGSGFRLAALDLEIRGAGNLLGGEQSGHIAAVGFELYTKLLEQAVRELKGEPYDEELRTSIDLRMDIQIPEHYIGDSKTRLWLYKRISATANEEALGTLREEAIDRFGKYPHSVASLFEYARLRLRAQRLKMLAIERKGERILLRFRDDTSVKPEDVISLVSSRRNLAFSPDGALVLHQDGATHSEIFQNIYNILEDLDRE